MSDALLNAAGLYAGYGLFLLFAGFFLRFVPGQKGPFDYIREVSSRCSL